MLRIIIYALYLAVCAGAIVTYINSPGQGDQPDFVVNHPVVVGVVLLVITQAVALVDWLIPHKRIETISAVYFGLLIGILLSYLLILALDPVIEPPYRGTAVLVTLLVLPYLCISLLLQTKDDFRFVIPYVEFSRELKAGRPLVLDSSALIDGRIADIVETNIFDAEMVVPQFILHEVQNIADSSEKIRRSRGRRGLEVLNRLQNNPRVEVRMHESRLTDFDEMSVDQALVEVAKQLGGRVVTNDFNLNKVASVQGIPVINLNDVANALKPRYLPGERLHVRLIKEGESAGQGVGYLDDGTMVVCEQTSHLLGKEIDAVVTSVLQSSAGRMIFARQDHDSGGDGKRQSS